MGTHYLTYHMTKFYVLRASALLVISSGEDNRSATPHFPGHLLSWRGGYLIIVSDFTPSSRNRDPEHCILSEERNPARQSPQRVLIICIFGNPFNSRGTLEPWGRQGSCLRHWLSPSYRNLNSFALLRSCHFTLLILKTGGTMLGGIQCHTEFCETK
jgi:hypothetical protein